MLRDVSNVDMRTRILGQEVAFPVCVAATAMQRMAHEDGELATARGEDYDGSTDNIYDNTDKVYIIIFSKCVTWLTAAAKVGSCMMLSSYSTTSIEDVAAASGSGLRWFQLYVLTDKDLTRDFILRAERSGYKAIVVTVDTPVGGRANARNSFNIPPHLSLENFSNAGLESARKDAMYARTSDLIDHILTWETIDWIRRITRLPILLKGILTAEDAEEALKHDVQGIIVSNHGARQLDGVPATVS